MFFLMNAYDFKSTTMSIIRGAAHSALKGAVEVEKVSSKILYAPPVFSALGKSMCFIARVPTPNSQIFVEYAKVAKEIQLEWLDETGKILHDAIDGRVKLHQLGPKVAEFWSTGRNEKMIEAAVKMVDGMANLPL